MATLKDQTIASTYDLLVKRHETYVQTGTNIELMTDSSGATAPTGLYLESGAVTDYVGIGTATPISTLEIEAGLTTVGAVLTLGTKETTVVADDVIGRINFYAPLENTGGTGAGGGDQRLVGASIVAFARENFSNINNSTGLYFQTGTTAVADTQMVIDQDGKVGIGTVNPNAQLEVNMGADDGTIMTLASTDVSHAMTDEVETDVFGQFTKVIAAANGGGLGIYGYADGTISNGGLILGARHTAALDTTKSASGFGGVRIVTQLISSNTINVPAAQSNLFSVDGGGNTTAFIVDFEGDLFANNGTASTDMVTKYDDYTDAHLVRALDISGKDIGQGFIDNKFDKFVDYNHEKLAELNLVGRERDGTPNHFINVTGMQRLHNGAIWQQYTEMQNMKELMYDTMVELMGKDKADKKLANHDIRLLNENLLN